MKIIGLTGGIGSGKSTVARIFQILGTPVYHADERAKWLMRHDAGIIAALRDLFGSKVVNQNSGPDFQQIGKLVFSNPEKLERLNNIVHPRVAEDFSQWCASRQEKLLIKEAAIIFETGSDQLLDGVIVVTAPETIRIQRVMLRNGLSEAEVKLRMSRQWPEGKLSALADYRIINDESCLVIPQVMAIFDVLRMDEIS